MDDTCFDLLCKDLTADEAKVFRKMMAEWSNGDENGFPVQFALLTRVQWRAAALVPQAVNESRKLIELHLAEYRRQTAELVKNLSAVGEDQADELKNVVKAHTEALNQASGSFRSQLKSIGAFTQDIRKHLDDGISSYNHIKTDLKAGGEMFRKTCENLDGRINGVQLRRDWLAWLGLIAIGMVIGITIGVVLEAKFR
jgi:gas vesicle protein